MLHRSLIRLGMTVAAIAALGAAGTAVAAAASPTATTSTTTTTTSTSNPQAGGADSSPSPSTTSPSTVPPTTGTTTPPAVGGATPPASASAIPAVMVTPDSGLLHDQVVTVAGNGFTPGASIGIVECRVGATDESGCDLSTVRTTSADVSGAWSVAFTVRRELQIGSGIVNCVPEGCTIGAANTNNIGGEKAGMALHFANVPPPPPPALTVSPATGLVHRQVVSVSGSGFDANQPVFVSQCVQNSTGCNANLGFVVANTAGGFTTAFTVQREVGSLGGALTDCLSTPCVLRAQSGNDPLAQNQVLLEFANVALPTKPVFTVTPNTGLGARQAVTVAGHGYGANETLTLDECTRTSTFTNYTCFFFQSGAVTDATGSFTTTLTARRFIPGNPQRVDCAPSACLIAAYSYDDVLASSGADISFDPNAPRPPPPAVTVSPSTGLVNGQAVTVSGAGFSPNASIGMSQCRAGATSPSDCDVSISRIVQADANGSFSTQFPVHTQLQIPGSSPSGPPGPGPVPITPTVTTLDCRTAPGACSIGVADLSDYTEGARALLTFATTTVAPPSASNSPSTTGSTSGVLAFTGTSTARELMVLAAAAISLGATLVGLNRRGRRRHPPIDLSAN